MAGSVTKDLIDGIKLTNWDLRRFDETYRSASYRAKDVNSPDIAELKELCQAAYDYVSGSR